MLEPDLIEIFASPLSQAGIRAMLGVSGDQIDRSALHSWIARLGLETEWKLVAE